MYRSHYHIAIPLVGPLVVVVLASFIQILLEFFNAGVEFLFQSYIEDFLFDRLINAFREPVYFRGDDACFTMLYAI